MSKSLKAAIGIQVAIMVSVLVPPLLNIMTGETVYLETVRVDPRALVRGDYVILDYKIGLEVEKELVQEAYEEGSVIYVTVTTDRPAGFVAASLKKPMLDDGQRCLIARPLERVMWDWDAEFQQSYVSFPQISQYFVPEGTGRAIEQDINDMVAELSVTKGCKAVVRGLELL